MIYFELMWISISPFFGLLLWRFDLSCCYGWEKMLFTTHLEGVSLRVLRWTDKEHTRLVIWTHLLYYPSILLSQKYCASDQQKPWALNAQNVGDRIQMGNKSFGSKWSTYLLKVPLNEFIDVSSNGMKRIAGCTEMPLSDCIRISLGNWWIVKYIIVI